MSLLPFQPCVGISNMKCVSYVACPKPQNSLNPAINSAAVQEGPGVPYPNGEVDEGVPGKG